MKCPLALATLVLVLLPGTALSGLASPPQTSACQAQRYQRTFSRWLAWGDWLAANQTDDSPLPEAVLQAMTAELALADKQPKTSQLAIDRLTFGLMGTDDLAQPQPLLRLLKQTPPDRHPQFRRLVDHLVKVSRALPPGYNYAQSRAWTAAAIAYHRLGQSPDPALLQQATQRAEGIRQPLLRAEMQLRIAQAWLELGQMAPEKVMLDQAAMSVRGRDRTNNGYVGQVADVLIQRYLQRQEYDQATVLAKTLAYGGEGANQMLQVVLAYQKAQQTAIAATLFEQTFLSQASRPADGYVTTEAIIAFAQVGGLTSAARVAAQLSPQAPQYQARAWLVIAGEARQQRQPDLAAQALMQLVAAGRRGKNQGFGMGFGDQRDSDWSYVLYSLSTAYGYEPEMLQFITQLQLQSEGAEFLIAESIKAKQFKQAREQVPNPMWRAIDAGFFDVQYGWLLQVAVAAADAGNPQQLLDLATRLEQTLVEQGAGDISEHRSALNLVMALRAVRQSKAAQPLIVHLRDQALYFINQPSNSWGVVAATELDFRRSGLTTEADQIRQAWVTTLQAIADPKQRVQQFLTLVQGSQMDLTAMGQWAEQVGVSHRPEWIGFSYTQVNDVQDLDAISTWITPASPTPQLKVVHFSRLGNLYLNRDRPQQAQLWLDRALAILKTRPNTGQDSEVQQPSISDSLISGYLRLEQIDQAVQVAHLIPDQAKRKVILENLACL